jgi:hypothetical protein
MVTVSTDYLVVGAGAAGLAFVDSVVTHADADVLLVDRRAEPGGHWNDAYSFLRLHLPSAVYGVGSRSLGADSIDADGDNAGFYERATADEIQRYFASVLHEQLLPTGRVRFAGETEYVTGDAGRHLLRDPSGVLTEVQVRRKLVDATYFEGAVPSTHTPSFEVEDGVRVVPVGALPEVVDSPSRYVVVGGGKTSMDACAWLLASGVPAERIRWVRPREAWVLERSGWQPRELVASVMEGMSLEVEALAQATSVSHLFALLEQRGRMMRIDESVEPTTYHCAILSRDELAQLRRVDDVVRMGRVRRITPRELQLEQGTVEAEPDDLYVDCSAIGLRRAPARPVFEPGRITLQQVRSCQPTFNAALIGYVEATRDDLEAMNRLCPPNPYPDVPHDWLSNTAISLRAARAWQAEPDLAQWLEQSRLNLLAGILQHLDEPRVQDAIERFGRNIKTAVDRLGQLSTQDVAVPAQPGSPDKNEARTGG